MKRRNAKAEMLPVIVSKMLRQQTSYVRPVDIRKPNAFVLVFVFALIVFRQG